MTNLTLLHTRVWIVVLVFSFLFSFSSNAQDQKAITTTVNSSIGGYYECLPTDYKTSSKKYPVIIFLHGIGEIGNGSADQITKVLRNGPPKLINEKKFPASFRVNGADFSFIVISPQFNSNARNSTVITTLIDYVVKNYRVDLDRIYLSGLSMGGGIGWVYVGGKKELSERLAAFVPVCGNTQPATANVNNIVKANLPIKIYHNESDPTVPSSYSKNWSSQLNAAGIKPATQLTIFPVSGHDAWSKAYDPAYKENGLNVYEWMLTHSRNQTTQPVNQLPVARAGSDVNIILPTSMVQLNANTSTDPDGTIVSYSWSKISGPTSFSINSSTVVNPQISQLTEGKYVIQLTVKDNSGAVATDDVIINVSPAPSVYASVPGKIEAENYTAMNGVLTESTSDSVGGLNVGWLEVGDWMDYNLNVRKAANYKIEFRVAAPAAGSKLQLRKFDGTVLSSVDIPQTGGYQTWTTIQTSLNLSAGNQVIRLYVVNSGWNINWIQFSEVLVNPIPPIENTPSKSINVNVFGGASPYSSTEWNNWKVSTKAPLFKYSDGSSSTVTASVSNAGTIGDNGTTYNGGAVAPAQVLRYSSYATAKRTLSITGLNPKRIYTIELYATRSSNPGNSTIFSIGNSNQTIATYNNSTQKALFQNLVSDASGEIVVTLSNSSTFNYLNGFKIIESEGLNTTSSSSAARINTVETLVSVNSTDLSGNASAIQLTVYPNPVQDQFTIQLNSSYIGDFRALIVDINGQTRKDLRLNKPSQLFTRSINVSDLPAGTYILKVVSLQWNVFEKFIKL